ncbi:hypothetical protein JCM19237_6668 [Photobacterium aphoticum]|uniref:Uncharacterized protein n=1 Tax=Photobacterium aphoticum TaxID=754436 RepID=A0A090QPM5_9GAMM|nr:hypothetical protein JCM19237_6668 [Photobacterium aphoticum]
MRGDNVIVFHPHVHRTPGAAESTWGFTPRYLGFTGIRDHITG